MQVEEAKQDPLAKTNGELTKTQDGQTEKSPGLDDDAEEWIRNNIVLKAKFLSRMGMGSKMMGSMSKEDVKRISVQHEKEKLKQEKEESSLLDEDLEVERSYSNAQGDFSLNFFKRTDDEIRQSYINKLINMKILKLEPAKKHQSSRDFFHFIFPLLLFV